MKIILTFYKPSGKFAYVSEIDVPESIAEETAETWFDIRRTIGEMDKIPDVTFAPREWIGAYTIEAADQVPHLVIQPEPEPKDGTAAQRKAYPVRFYLVDPDTRSPRFNRGVGWYWWDETWACAAGPYSTRAGATFFAAEYAKTL